MNCPDWPRLSERRDAEPGAWERALAHADGCARCRQTALDAEPTLLFRRLPGLEVGSEEIAAMKRSVAEMRRASRRPPGGRWRASLRAAALAAVLAGAALLQGTPRLGRDHDPPRATAAAPSFTPADTSFASLEQMPLVELLDPASGPVVQVVDDEISLVLVLPPSDV